MLERVAGSILDDDSKLHIDYVISRCILPSTPSPQHLGILISTHFAPYHRLNCRPYQPREDGTQSPLYTHQAFEYPLLIGLAK